MGTRSLTIFKDSKKEICVMYRQFDGYLAGHGKDLAEFLSGRLMTNGIREGKTANGMGCLTAQVIAHFKNEVGIGGIYIYPPKTRDCWEEYIYTVEGKEGEEPKIGIWEIHTKEYGGNKMLFSGFASDVLKWINEQDNK